MLREIQDRACLIPFYETAMSTAAAKWYEDANGSCNPDLTPSRGCKPPFYSTADPGVFTDYKGNCNPEFSPDAWFTVAPTPGRKPSLSNQTLMLIGAAVVLLLVVAKR